VTAGCRRPSPSLSGMPDPLVDAALDRATGALPAHEDRPSQRDMAGAVAAAIRQNRHLIIQAGTGTGKSLAYLVPALTLGTRVVVSTATKALQDQLATRDLPKLAESLGAPFEFAVLKGRSNYLCRQRAAEVAGGDQQMVLDPENGGPAADTAPGGGSALGPLGRELVRLVAWGQDAVTGDRADLPWEPSEVAWAHVSVGSRDCPGANRCPSGGVCFAEAARERAMEADVVVVNTHLYATALAIEGELLPPHDLVVFDEAHELEDIASAAFGFDIGGGRLVALGRTSRPLLEDISPAVAVEDAAVLLQEALKPHIGSALPHPLDGETEERLVVTRERVNRLLAEIRRAIRMAQPSDGTDTGRHLRNQQAATHLLKDLDQVLELDKSEVAWVEGPEHAPVLRVAPLDVGAAFREKLWSKMEGPTAVLTSATVPPRLGDRLGLMPGSYDQLDVGSPFAYDEQALLYCPLHLPDPRDAGFEKAMHEELVALIEAAEGRTLALFTSWRAMRAAADALRDRMAWPLLTQSDLPKPALVARFSSEEHSCLFATMGFWRWSRSTAYPSPVPTIPSSRPGGSFSAAPRSR
jgi:ATP-dependent DNA helicase DinG